MMLVSIIMETLEKKALVIFTITRSPESESVLNAALEIRSEPRAFRLFTGLMGEDIVQEINVKTSFETTAEKNE